MKVLGMGNALVDMIYQLQDDSILERFILPKGSMTLIDGKRLADMERSLQELTPVMISGGSAANTVHGLNALGVETGFIGSVGQDIQGGFYMEEMLRLGIRPHFLRSGQASGRAMAFVTPDSERTFATFLGAALDLQPALLDEDWFRAYDIFHIEGYLVQNYELIESALRLAHQAGCRISLDLASYNVVEEHLGFLRRIVPEWVDILFANEEEARAFTGKDPEGALQEISGMCDVAVVKRGSEGALVMQGGRRYDLLPHRVDPVDTSGAGDLFAAGFLFGFTRAYDPEVSGMIGNLIASKVIGVLGPKIPVSLWPELKEELKLYEG